jgi:hypothetical protein
MPLRRNSMWRRETTALKRTTWFSVDRPSRTTCSSSKVQLRTGIDWSGCSKVSLITLAALSFGRAPQDAILDFRLSIAQSKLDLRDLK